MSFRNPKTGQKWAKNFRNFQKIKKKTWAFPILKNTQGERMGMINYSKVVYFESKCVYPSRVSTGHGPSGFMKKINSRYMCAKDIGARFFLTHLKTLY